MATAALAPRVRLMVICDGVRENAIEAGVFDLKGVRQGITAGSFPFTPRRLRLFLVLSSHHPGVYPAYVVIVNERDGKTIFYAHLEPSPRFGYDGLWATRPRIRCAFPEQGTYTIQLWFFREQGADILKAELPFFVITEGTDQ
jgi:hypothetical protein